MKDYFRVDSLTCISDIEDYIIMELSVEFDLLNVAIRRWCFLFLATVRTQRCK